MIEDGFRLSPGETYELLESVYASTDAFVSDFSEEYSSAEAVGAYFAELATRPGSVFLVARDEGGTLGYLLVEPRRPRKLRHTADLNMGLRERARGRGLGGKLLDAALARLREDGIIEILYLMVRADNDAAIRLYQRAGFEKLAVLERDTKIDSRCFDGILMRKPIREVE